MAETLRNRVSQIIVGSAHALMDKIEGQAPEAMMEQSIRKVRDVIDEVRAELGKVAANRHLAQRQHADLNQRHLELTTQAEQALGMGREDLARVSVARQLDIEAQIPIVEGSLTELNVQERELSGYVEALIGKKRDMTATLDQYISSRKLVAGTTNVSSGTNNAQAVVERAGESFSRVFQRQTGLSAGDQKVSAVQNAQLKELEGLMQNQKIEARLAQLKVTKS